MKHIIPSSIYLMILCLFTHCNQKKEVPEIKTVFCLTDSLQKKITIAEAKAQTVKNKVLLSGKVQADEDKWVKVFPVVSGVVQQLHVELGDYVTKGQVLAVIQSSELADYQGQLSFAQSGVTLAEKNLASSKELFKAGLATEKDVVAAETELDKARAELKKTQQTTSIYGAHSNAVQTLTAPISGYIVEKNVTDKMQYRADGMQSFFTIANLDEVWVMANVFESDIAKIKEGYDAEIAVIAYKDKKFTGKIDRIFSVLDPQSRVMKVRIRINNTDKLLRPEMFAQISVKYDDGSNQLPAIPSSAMIFDKNKNYVMVYKDNCNIETRQVEIFDSIGDTTYIKSGVQEGEKVISSYQLLIYDAIND